MHLRTKPCFESHNLFPYHKISVAVLQSNTVGVGVFMTKLPLR